MAITDLASGRRVHSESGDDEIAMFLLAKEFGWTPSQIRNENTRDVKCISHMLSVYNSVQSRELKKK